VKIEAVLEISFCVRESILPLSTFLIKKSNKRFVSTGPSREMDGVDKHAANTGGEQSARGGEIKPINRTLNSFNG